MHQSQKNEDTPPGSRLSDAHATLLQAVLAGMVIPEQAFLALAVSLKLQEGIYVSLETINTAIAPTGLRIVSAVDEAKNERVYVAKNTKEPPEIGAYSIHESEVAAAVLEIVMDGGGRADSLSLINRTFQRIEKRVPQKEIEEVIEALAKEHWLCSREGIITLGVRTVVDLEHHLLSTYPAKIFKCAACFQPVLEPSICMACGTRTHRSCACSVCGPARV